MKGSAGQAFPATKLPENEEGTAQRVKQSEFPRLNDQNGNVERRERHAEDTKAETRHEADDSLKTCLKFEKK